MGIYIKEKKRTGVDLVGQVIEMISVFKMFISKELHHRKCAELWAHAPIHESSTE